MTHAELKVSELSSAIFNRVEMRVIIFTVLWVISTHAAAMNWKFNPSVTVDANYTDNLILQATDPKSDTWYRVVPTFTLDTENDRYVFSGAMRYRVLRYQRDTKNNNEEVLASITTSRKYEGLTWGLSSRYELTANRTTALEDSGLVGVVTDRELSSLTLSMQTQMSEKLSLNMGLTGTEVRYPDVTDDRLIDYKNYSVNSSVSQKMTARSQLLYTLTASRFKPAMSGDGVDSSVDNTELRFTFQRDISETFSIKVIIGGRKTRVRVKTDVMQGDAQIVESSEKRTVGGIEFHQKFENSSWKGQLKTEVIATGLGSAQEQKKLQMSYDRQLAPRLSLNVSVTRNQNKSLSKEAGGLNRQYTKLRVGLSWNISRVSAMIGGYQFIRQDSDALSGNALRADENSVSIRIDYKF